MSDMEEWSRQIEDNEIYENTRSDQTALTDKKKALKLKENKTSRQAASGIASAGK